MVVVSAVAFLSLYAAPEGSARAQVLLDNPRSAEGLHILNEGRFRKQRDGHYVTYAEQIDDAGARKDLNVELT
jgi:lipopolysaccharide export system permease protein